LIAGEQTGGTWARSTGTGGTFVAATGSYTPAAGATTSTFTYTVTGASPCVDDTALATVNIAPEANAGTDGTTSVCDNSAAAIDLFSLIAGEQTGGTWARTTGTGGTFVAATGSYTPAAGATTSAFTYTVTGASPCVDDTALATVNIAPEANAGTDGTTTVCDNSAAAIDLFSLIAGEQTGGAWARTTGTGGTFVAATGSYTPAAGATTSTFTYTVIGASPCVDDTALATVNIYSAPTGLNVSQIAPTCSSGFPTNSGVITVTAITNADKYGISTGGIYTGPSYGTATSIGAVPFDAMTMISNLGGTYTLRVFNSSDGCYSERVENVLPITCCPTNNCSTVTIIKN
jgi:hypothetical protein